MRYRSCCLFVFIVTSVVVAGTAFAGPINGRVVDPDIGD
jgi:hypothetical protein